MKKERLKAEKQQRAETRKRKAKLNDTIPVWKKKAQASFNAYIRERDRHQPCISCGKPPTNTESLGGDWDCGHYRSVGACPELRFEPLNAHKQCKHCNSFLSGNIVEYRKGLIERIGQKKLDWVEGNHELKRYRVDELKQIDAHFKKLKKELLNG